ncbi:hypothetical protein BDU57DRAFT_509384 [Ampelomyces quisqualis]|uniref:Uncharacterized protein n=1 Tax=Ampelomyces quisqualis TaxID=50730 RepID=A0A6A5QYQ4_AMPQU|nr:hypothetical protein BDU57DRAFT_509384 [Ampelomyces quisqualis]
MSQTKMQVKPGQKEREDSRLDRRGRWLAEMLGRCWWKGRGGAAQWAFLSSCGCAGRSDVQCSWRAKTGETRCIEARGGGAASMWRSAIWRQYHSSVVLLCTTWSLTRRPKHGAAGWASTWSVRKNASGKRRMLFAIEDAPEAVWRRGCVVCYWRDSSRRVPKRQARAGRLQQGRLDGMKPAWSAPHSRARGDVG